MAFIHDEQGRILEATSANCSVSIKEYQGVSRVLRVSDTKPEYHAYQRSISRVSWVSRHTFAYGVMNFSLSIRRVSDEYQQSIMSIRRVSDEYQTSIRRVSFEYHMSIIRVSSVSHEYHEYLMNIRRVSVEYQSSIRRVSYEYQKSIMRIKCVSYEYHTSIIRVSSEYKTSIK